MNLLLSAIACHPKHGSESGVGWKTATALSKRHHVHVLTWEGERKGIQEALATGAYPNLSFTYLGKDATCHKNRLVARIQSWNHYVAWTRQSLEVARRLAATRKFDVAHHVTYSSWRVPSPLWQLDLPFVWGPVGGAAEFPYSLLGRLSLNSAIYELARGLSNRQAVRSNALRQCVRNSSAIVASNRETFDRLMPLRGKSEGMYQLFPTFFGASQVERLNFDPGLKPSAKPLRLFSGGNIIGSKGMIFALEALALLTKRGIDWRLVVGGHGPETPFLEKKARAFGIQDCIEFHPGFSGQEYMEQLKNSHVFILPSFRENAGITMMEAMLAGCVPVIVDASAQAAVVNEYCGFKIPVGRPDTITEGLADALDFLARNPQRRVEMGRNASMLVEHGFRDESYVQKMTEIYEEAVSCRSSCSTRQLD